jgi:DNA-binding PadR family transcriptional regulator
MNLTRLMALGILARSGPSHGHHIRRLAEVTNVGEWGGVPVGALYRELRTMEREGLVEAARTEKVGNRPERTVYQITDEGQLELTTLREQAIRQQEFGPNPLGVALTFATAGVEREQLRRGKDRPARGGQHPARHHAHRDRDPLARPGRRGAGGGYRRHRRFAIVLE